MDRTKMLVTYFKLSEKEMRERYLPVSASDLLRKKIFAVGSAHVAVLEEDGTVSAYGDNRFGQCNVHSWRNIVKVAAGDFHTVGLRADGTLTGVGDDTFGQCDLAQWRGITEVYAARNLTIGVKEDGSLLFSGSTVDVYEQEREKERRRREDTEQTAALMREIVNEGIGRVEAKIGAANGDLLSELKKTHVAAAVPVSVPDEDPESSENVTPEEQFSFSCANGAVIIKAYLGNDAVVYIPRTIQGMPVTIVGNRAFCNNARLKKIVLSDTLLQIYPDAFKGCRKLEEIVIPREAQLNQIGDNAFEQCSSLKKVTFPESLERIARWAFVQCTGLETVIIPNDIRSIGFGAFSECPALKNVFITQSAQNRLGRLDLIIDNLNVVKIIQPGGM